MSRAPSLTWTILKRELVTGLRSGQRFALLAALLSMLYFVALTMLPSATFSPLFAARYVQGVFWQQCFLLLLTALFFVPTAAAGSLDQEWRDDNFDLLTTSLIPPSRIILGKFFATLVVFLLFVAAFLPLTGMVYFFAGVDVVQFFRVAVGVGSIACASSALGIGVSAVTRKGDRAFLLTLGLVFVVNFVVPQAFVTINWTRPFSTLFTPFSLLSDLTPMALILQYALYQLAVTVAALSVAMVALKYQSRISAGAGMLEARVFSWPRHPFRAIPDASNPIVARECLGHPYLHGRAAWGISVLVFLVFVAVFYGSYLHDAQRLSDIGLIERVAMLILLPPLMARAFLRHREESTWDSLRLTLIKHEPFYHGLSMGILRKLLPLIGPVYVAHLLLIGLGLYFDGERIPMWAFLIVGEAILFPFHCWVVLAASLSFVAFTRRVPAAVGGAYVGGMGATLFLTVPTTLALYEMDWNSSGDFSSAIMGLVVMIFAIALPGVFVLVVGLERINSLWGSTTYYIPPPEKKRPVDGDPVDSTKTP